MISYRALKKLVGETSLERKCRFLFGAALLILITASFWLYANRTRALVENQQVITARSLVDRILQIRHYQEFVKQVSDETVSDDAFIRSQISKFDKTLETLDGLPPSSLAMTWNLLDLENTLPESDAGFQAINLFEDPDQEADEHWVFREDDKGSRELVYFAAIRPSDSCIECHKPPYRRPAEGTESSIGSTDSLAAANPGGSPGTSPGNGATSSEQAATNASQSADARRETLMGMVRVGLSMETVEAQLTRNQSHSACIRDCHVVSGDDGCLCNCALHHCEARSASERCE